MQLNYNRPTIQVQFANRTRIEESKFNLVTVKYLKCMKIAQYQKMRNILKVLRPFLVPCFLLYVFRPLYSGSTDVLKKKSNVIHHILITHYLIINSNNAALVTNSDTNSKISLRPLKCLKKTSLLGEKFMHCILKKKLK